MQPATITFPFPRRLAIWAEPCLKVGRYLVSEEGDSLPSIDTMEQLPYADFLNSGAYEPNIGWIDPFYWDNQTSLDNPGQSTKNQTQQIASSVAVSSAGIYPKNVLYDQNPPTPKPNPTWFDMVVDEAVREANKVAGDSPLQCQFPGCPDRRAFPTKSALRRHVDKHSRPYICKEPQCNNRDFGDKGGLRRHEKEVHLMNSPILYRCPVRSCKRHQRGFPRKYNLFEHQKRCHQQPATALLAPFQTPRESSEGVILQDLGSDGAGDETPKETAMTNCSLGNSTTGEEELRVKLQNLRNVRTELDADILTLERALGIIGDTCL